MKRVIAITKKYMAFFCLFFYSFHFAQLNAEISSRQACKDFAVRIAREYNENPDDAFKMLFDEDEKNVTDLLDFIEKRRIQIPNKSLGRVAQQLEALKKESSKLAAIFTCLREESLRHIKKTFTTKVISLSRQAGNFKPREKKSDENAAEMQDIISDLLQEIMSDLKMYESCCCTHGLLKMFSCCVSSSRPDQSGRTHDDTERIFCSYDTTPEKRTKSDRRRRRFGKRFSSQSSSSSSSS